MIRNYCILALRNLRKRMAFSLINIVGLALGISACLIILHYIDFETSYDNFNKHAASLYRINRTYLKNEERQIPTMMTTYGLGPALATDLPEVKRFIRTHEERAVATCFIAPDETKAFHESKILAVDTSFFHAFTFGTVSGNLAVALDDPNSIVLTETIARKYFQDTDPIGKTITLSGGRMNGTYTVSAVMKDVPPNSHFTFTMLLPLHNILQSDQYRKDDGWGWNNFTTYVQLNENAGVISATQKLPDFCKRRLDPKWTAAGGRVELSLQPLRDIHLHPGLRHDAETISPDTIYFFGIIAAFILFIAWINYINLSTARATERSREVGIKKTIGAVRGELVLQFLFEAILINIIGIALAVVLTILLLPVLGEIIGKELVFNISDSRLWGVLAVLFFAGTLGSGVYPAFVLSSYRITHALKGQQQAHGFSLRQVLVVFQFASSLVLIAGTFAVYRQINFMQTQDTGLQMDQMLIVSGPGTLSWNDAKQKLTLLKDEAQKIAGVQSMATSGAIPGGGYNWGADIRKSGTLLGDMKLGSVVWIDPDFISTYNIPFVAGKNFDPAIKSDMESVIINEASLTAYGLGTAEQALNEQLIMQEDTVRIIGVLKNYNWNSLKSEYVPFLFRADTIVPGTLSFHIAGQSVSSAVDKIGQLYKDILPGDPFEYQFLDDSFNAQYKSDRQFGDIFGMFAILAVSISCLGLWGLASFTTSQKMKEIGVRKILGASPRTIVLLLSGQFMRLIVVAALIALPLAWYGMDTWLHSFAFRIGLQWDLFVLPVVLLAGIALFTVSVQVLKGASVNPVKVLKAE